jgi:hypothetical protein
LEGLKQKNKIIKIIAFIINVWKAPFSSYKIPDAKEKCLQTEHKDHIPLTKVSNIPEEWNGQSLPQ